MYINNFERALNSFDEELDRLASISQIHTSESFGFHRDDPPGYAIGTATTYIPANDSCMTDSVSKTTTVKDDMDITKDIKQVIFNDPATIVTFADGTKVCVKACANDKFSKEVGLVYALVKRLYANDIDENGYLKSTGLGEKLNKIIKGAVDQKELARKKAEEKAAKKAKKDDAAKADKPAKKVSAKKTATKKTATKATDK